MRLTGRKITHIRLYFYLNYQANIQMCIRDRCRVDKCLPFVFWCADKMSTGEFDLIGRYFSVQQGNQHFVDFSIGDDCAITHIPEGYQLAITTDTMVEGTHFLSSISPQDLAYKARCV